MGRFRVVVGAVSTALLCALAACVPSPTATPPLATAFPTLVLPTETDTPPPTTTSTATAATPSSPNPASLPTPTATLTSIPPTANPSPIASAKPELLAPLLRVSVFPSTGPISANQPVALSILAAANSGVTRLELYDENVLYSASPSPDPPPPTISIVVTWKSQRLGLHHLRVLAYDIAGNASAPADLEFMVLTDNRPPFATITVPIGEVDVPMGAPFVLQGVATDEVAIARVDLFIDNQLYTYLNSIEQVGESPLAVTFMWVPTTAGVHQLFLRAHDNEGGTGDSPPLLANVLDVQAPAVTASYESDEMEPNGTLLVHALALSANNITRVELWADNEIAQVAESAAADTQTLLDVRLVWEGGAVGDHTLFVRAYDRAGLSASTVPQIIHVRSLLSHAPTVSPTAAAAMTATPAIQPTSTPQEVSPAPPTINLTTEDRAALPGPVHLRLAAHGSIELDHVEIWAVYQGEANPELLFSDGAKGATDKTFDYAWSPAGAGVVQLFARVVDQLGQAGQSPVTFIYLVAPPAPTLTPAFFNLAPRWAAQIPTNKFAVEFSQFGTALRGTFTNTPLNGTSFSGSIIGGSVARERVVFSVDFETPDAEPHSLDFICSPSAAPAQLACNYKDEMGNRGSAVFAPSP